VRNLTPDQKLAVERLLGRPISEDEQISIGTAAPDSAPEWLRRSWQSAESWNLDRLSPDEIDAEIAAARRERNPQSPVGR
jgi:hypothetical protein